MRGEEDMSANQINVSVRTLTCPEVTFPPECMVLDIERHDVGRLLPQPLTFK